MAPDESPSIELSIEAVGKLRFLKAESDGVIAQIRIPLHFEKLEPEDLDNQLKPYCIDLYNKLTALKNRRNATN